MSFYYISYLQLWYQSCSAECNHLGNFGRRHYEEHFIEIILNLDKWFRKSYCSKHFLSTASADIFIGRAKIFRYFGRENYEELFCEIVLNLDQWFMRRIHLNIFLIYSSGSSLTGGVVPLGDFGREY